MPLTCVHILLFLGTNGIELIDQTINSENYRIISRTMESSVKKLFDLNSSGFINVSTFITFRVFRFVDVNTHHLIREHPLGYIVLTIDSGFKIFGHATKPQGRFHLGFTNLLVNAKRIWYQNVPDLWRIRKISSSVNLALILWFFREHAKWLRTFVQGQIHLGTDRENEVWIGRDLNL